MAAPLSNGAWASTIVSSIVGAALVFGGAMGYIKKRSFASLMAGGVSGAALILAAKLTHSGNPDGAVVSVLVSVALTIVMGRRYLESKAPLAGAISGLCIITALVNGLYWATK
jgi:uncharacterized membrane protein (UPF0136 family)